MSHFYWPDGKPCYTVPRADGKGERDTTLRDAKKLGLIPSVTTIIKQTLAAPALSRWIEGQLLKAAYDCPPAPGEPLADWEKHIREVVAKDGEDRMGFGTKIHDSLETALKSEPIDLNEVVVNPCGEEGTLSQYVLPVMDAIRDRGWRPVGLETTLVGNGYAGKADMVYVGEGEYGVVDFKTTKDAVKPFVPDSYPAQIAMYHVAEHGGIDDRAAGYNVFISSERNIGTVHVEKYDAAKLREAYAFGMHLVAAWQYINNYIPKQ